MGGLAGMQILLFFVHNETHVSLREDVEPFLAKRLPRSRKESERPGFRPGFSR